MNYQLVIQFPIANEFADVFDRIILLETELRILLGDKHSVDGHGLGTDKLNIFIQTDDPNEAFDIAKKALSEVELKSILVASREKKGEEYSVLWPENFSGECRFDP
jgi:hypothetical protein